MLAASLLSRSLGPASPLALSAIRGLSSSPQPLATDRSHSRSTTSSRPMLDLNNRSSAGPSPRASASAQSSRQRRPISSHFHFAAKPARPSNARFSPGAGSGARPRSSKPRADLLTKRHSPSQFVLLDPSTPPSTSAGSRLSAPAQRPARTCAQLGLDDQVTAAMIESIRSSFGSSPPDHIAPTEIQSLTARAILDPPPASAEGGQPRAFMLAAETGSGKTLAYLAPVLHTIRTQEQEYAVQFEAYTKALAEAQVKHDEAVAHNAKVTEAPSDSTTAVDLVPVPKLPPKPLPLRRPGYPRAVILVPSHELLHQVGAVAKAMSHTARARIVMATTSTPTDHFKRIMTEPVDVLITTPGSLTEFIKKETVTLSETRVVVFDEADFVFDQGFDKEAREVVQHVCKVAKTRSKHHATSSAASTAGNFVPTFLFVTATVPKSLHAMLETQFPTPGSLHFLATSSLHRPLTRCTQSFVDVAKQFQSNKQAALLDVLRSTHDFDHGAALVFANTRQGVDTVHSFLTSRSNIPNVLKLSKRQTIEERAATWHAFRTTPGAVLVATDVAARGLDTTHVDLVVNFDFPSSALEYLHRIGRTARAGRKGRAVSLVTRRSKELVLAIQQRLKMKRGMGMGRMA